MSCDKHDELKGLLERVDERTANMQCSVESYFKIAQWLFAILLFVFGSVVGYNVIRTDNLEAKMHNFHKGIQECDFSEVITGGN